MENIGLSLLIRCTFLIWRFCSAAPISPWRKYCFRQDHDLRASRSNNNLQARIGRFQTSGTGCYAAPWRISRYRGTLSSPSKFRTVPRQYAPRLHAYSEAIASLYLRRSASKDNRNLRRVSWPMKKGAKER